ncbi:DUF4838 domain-containing protein [Paenibacillus ginsengarvi]|uniref:DUF4838 domain-containing protein n=1 Tax=Paenibacillus ginsengarvi TaxID=400777 RepID=A0A3B0C8Q8_9BACL|nr:DUF4838 domain-containing protein [Paenibacillus ginsengarvi]RKN81950.1 DUF4838 domain-containing protein [Paenibacillus ginsengarvi]
MLGKAGRSAFAVVVTISLFFSLLLPGTGFARGIGESGENLQGSPAPTGNSSDSGSSQVSGAVYGDPLYLVQNGAANSVIVMQNGETKLPQAVEELRNDIYRATGVILPVVNMAGLQHVPEGTVRIAVGPGPLAQSLGIVPDTLDEEEYRIVTSGNHLVFMGSESRADLWAVTYFLDRYMGVRWLWPGEIGTYVPKSDDILVPAMDVIDRPSLLNRRLRVPAPTPQEGVDWLSLHQMGSRSPYTFGHSFTKWWDKYSATHPEYFAMPPAGYSLGPTDRVKLDIGNPAVDDVIIQEWQAAGAPDNWNVSPNDGTGFCVSAACLAMDTPAGQAIAGIWTGKANLTARYVRFWNRLLEKMRLINPEVELSAYAYSAYREPPPAGVTLNGGMVLGFVNTYWTYDAWRDWADAGAKLFLRPNWWYSGAVAPYLPLHEQGDFFKYAGEHEMVGFDFDTLRGNWGTQGPLYYLVARLSERPDLSVDEVLTEYASAFGAAEPMIADYLDFWEQFAGNAAYTVNAGETVSRDTYGTYETLARAHGLTLEPIVGSYEILPYLYTDTVLTQARAILDQAEALATGDAEALARIGFFRDGLRNLELTRDVVEYGYERTRPAEATWAEFVQRLQQLEAFRKESASRHVVWADTLYDFEQVRNVPTEPTRSSGWAKSSSPQTANLLINPDFELDSDRNGMPDSWTFRNNMAWNDQEHHSGQYSAEMIALTPTTKTTVSPLNASVQPVLPGQFYTLNVWIKNPSSSSGAEVMVRKYDSAKNLLRGNLGIIRAAANSDWTKYELSFIIPDDGTIYIGVWLNANNFEGTAYFDDFYLWQDTSGATPPQLLNVTAGPVTAGESVSATSTKDGILYLVPKETEATRPSIETAGQSASGRAAAVVENVYGALDTTGLPPQLYRVYVIDLFGNVSNGSADISVLKSSPMISGVTDGGTYSGEVTITFNSVMGYTAKLNGKSLLSGTTVGVEGRYTLVVKSASGNETSVSFTIASARTILTIMAERIGQYETTGDMNAVFADQLDYRLQIVGILLDQGADTQAAAYMQDFLTYISDPAVLAQQLLSNVAKEELNQLGSAFLQT